MPPNKQNRKQRTRGKNATHSIRERTVLTLAEDPTSTHTYMLPAQSTFSPVSGNMFAQFQPHGQQQQSGVSIPDTSTFQYQQKSGIAPPFKQLQSSTFYNNKMQQLPRGVNSGEGLSDLEKLQQLKNTILAGQHPFFQPVPNPEALAKVYLGPHPASQAYQQQQQQQQNPQQLSTQAGHGSVLLSQPHSENASVTQKLDPLAQDGAKRPQTPSNSGPSRALESLPTPQSSGSIQTGISHQPASNGVTQRESGSAHADVTIPSKEAVNYRSTTPTHPPQNSAQSNTMHTSQHPQRGFLQSGLTGANNGQSDAAATLPPSASSTSLGDNAGASKPDESKESAPTYRGAHSASLSYGRERDRDRERPGNPVYDTPRYPQASDRRDYARYPPRYGDMRYEKDRSWDRGRDWERDKDRDREHERERERERGREKEWERDRDRRRVDDKFDERHIEYTRLSRPPGDRRPLPPQSGPNAEQKSAGPSEQHLSGQPPEPRRPNVSVHPEEPHSVIPSRPERSPHRPDPVASRPILPSSPSSAEQRRPDTSSLPYSYAGQTSQEHEHFRFGPAATQRPSTSQGTSATRLQSQPQPPQLLRPEQRLMPGPEAMDDRGGSHSDPQDQRASSGSAPLISGPPPHESIRRPEGSNLAGRPPVGGVSMPPPVAPNVSREVPERRLSHAGDSQLSLRAPAVPDSRTGNDDRDTSRPLYSHLSGPLPLRATSRPPSPGARQPGDTWGDRDRDHNRLAAPANLREPLPNTAAARGFTEDLRRQPMDASSLRRASDYYPATPSVPIPPIIDRQWRERESYPSASYADSDDRARRYANGRWVDVDAYGRERDGRASDVDGHLRPHPSPSLPPASWDRERPIDKDKERDRFEPWNPAERKYPAQDAVLTPPSGPPPRWDDPVPPHHVHRPPLHARLTDTYDERFVPVERARYPPLPSLSDDVPVRDSFRDNPRVRPRSPSPTGRGFDDIHRAKRPREEYDTLIYYEDVRRPLPSEYGSRVPPSPPSYYEGRASTLVNPREGSSPYSRDREPDVYPRRDMPPPRSPPFYARERYVPR